VPEGAGGKEVIDEEADKEGKLEFGRRWGRRCKRRRLWEEEATGERIVDVARQNGRWH